MGERGLRSSGRAEAGKEGSAQRGAGTRLRDATVEPIVGASLKCRSLRVSGVRSPRGPSSALRRARLRGSDGVGAHKHAVLSARLSPLPGRHDRSATPAPAAGTGFRRLQTKPTVRSDFAWSQGLTATIESPPSACSRERSIPASVSISITSTRPMQKAGVPLGPRRLVYWPPNRRALPDQYRDS
jgi:hypothetical protein